MNFKYKWTPSVSRNAHPSVPLSILTTCTRALKEIYWIHPVSWNEAKRRIKGKYQKPCIDMWCKIKFSLLKQQNICHARKNSKCKMILASKRKHHRKRPCYQNLCLSYLICLCTRVPILDVYAIAHLKYCHPCEAIESDANDATYEHMVLNIEFLHKTTVCKIIWEENFTSKTINTFIINAKFTWETVAMAASVNKNKFTDVFIVVSLWR